MTKESKDTEKKTQDKEEKTKRDVAQKKALETTLTKHEQLMRDLKWNLLMIQRSVKSKDPSQITSVQSRALRQLTSQRPKRPTPLTLTALVTLGEQYQPELVKYVSGFSAPILAKEAEFEKSEKDRVEKEKKDKEEKERIEKERREKERQEREKREAAARGGKKPKGKEEKDKEKEKEKEKEKAEEEARLAAAASSTAEAVEVKILPPYVPELQVYLHILYITYLMDYGHKDLAAKATNDLLGFLSTVNRRSMDTLSARAYFLFSLTHERIGKLADIRNQLLALHRTCALRHDESGQAVLINLILHNYLAFNLYAQADNFRLNSPFPENRSNSQQARYHFYTGRIQSVQLAYPDAFLNLSAALRKSPGAGAAGFKQLATKLLVIVQLLTGEIPERSLFRQKDLTRSLKPYFQLTKAVRIGNLAAFQEVVTTHDATFSKDKMKNLIQRLRHNVIKTGLKRITTSYSRISIKDIIEKLHLNSSSAEAKGLSVAASVSDETDAEYIVAKAIADGVIDAVIDRKNRFVFSKESVDVYSSNEPQQIFHRRTMIAMEVHNTAVKDMRYAPDAYKKLFEAKPEDFGGDDEEAIKADSDDD